MRSGSRRDRAAPRPLAPWLPRPTPGLGRDRDWASPQVLQLQGQVVSQEAVQLPPPGLPRERNPQHLVQVPGRGKENKNHCLAHGGSPRGSCQVQPRCSSGTEPGAAGFPESSSPARLPTRGPEGCRGEPVLTLAPPAAANRKLS